MSVDIARFHQAFFEEAAEGLETLEQGLLALAEHGGDPETLNAVFRAAHSMKGGAATFGFQALAGFTHLLETLLDEVRGGRRAMDEPLADALLGSVDVLRDLLAAAREGTEADAEALAAAEARLKALLGSGAGPALAGEGAGEGAAGRGGDGGGGGRRWRIVFRPHAHLLRTGNEPLRALRELAALGRLEASLDCSRLPALEALEPHDCHLAWTLTLEGAVERVQIDEIFEWMEGDCDLEIEALEDERPQRAADAAQQVPGPAGRPPARGEAGSIRVSIDKIDALINMVGELVITQSMLGQIGERLEGLDTACVERLRDGLAQLERNTRELQESVMRVRMVPISFAFARFPRMVRDLGRKLGKQVRLELAGEQTELDKTVMERISDPLVHLVRNAVDHGIEPPEARRAAGKPETGTVRLNAYHKGGNIVIEVSDDGAGIDRTRVLEKARERGLLGGDGEPAPDDPAVLDLIFEPGFSTAAEVTDVSGRGVGMDVVRRNIRELGGTIEVDSTPGRGSTFTIRLPLTLAILDGQLVRVGSEIYVVPLVSIVESVQLREEQLNTLAGDAEVYRLREDYIPVLRLRELLDTGREAPPPERRLLVVVEGDGHRAGLLVDELLGQQQVVIKSLESNFRRVEGISGATILGDGTVALILDVGGLVGLARARGRARPSAAAA